MSEQPPSPGIRLSDADREHAVQRLQTAMAEGRISLSEFDERAAAAYAARYAGDLQPLLADLPPAATGWSVEHGAPRPIPGYRPAVATPGPRPIVAGDASYGQASFPAQPEVIDPGWGTIKRRNKWLVPGWLRIQTGPGTVVLDLREATFAQQVIAIDVEVGVGSLKILVPESSGITADVTRVHTSIGTVSSRVSSLPNPPHPHLACAGKVGVGSLVIRAPYF